MKRFSHLFDLLRETGNNTQVRPTSVTLPEVRLAYFPEDLESNSPPYYHVILVGGYGQGFIKAQAALDQLNYYKSRGHLFNTFGLSEQEELLHFFEACAAAEQ